MAGAIAGFALAASASDALARPGTPPTAPSHAPSAVPKPKIDFDPIPFGDDRKRQMANYSHRHYGDREWRLKDPEAIVLHFTATSTYPPVFNTFADHVDWRRGDVREFRRLVADLTRSVRALGRASTPAERPQSRRIVFSHSVEGQRLVARRSGADNADMTALVVGEVHGDEEAGRAVVRRLRRRPGPLGGTALWTVTSLNPDGHERDGRTNANGVDLNRNFAVGWDGSEPEGSGYYPGPAPFSEPESRALRSLIRRLDPDVTIYYHQPWGAVLAPCSGPAPLQRRYAAIAQMPVDRCRGQRLPGTATRWQNERGGTAFVVELEPGRLSSGQAGRHARAVRAVAAR